MKLKYFEDESCSFNVWSKVLMTIWPGCQGRCLEIATISYFSITILLECVINQQVLMKGDTGIIVTILDNVLMKAHPLFDAGFRALTPSWVLMVGDCITIEMEVYYFYLHGILQCSHDCLSVIPFMFSWWVIPWYDWQCSHDCLSI